MSNIRVKVNGNSITVASPYDAKFVSAARQLGGQFQHATYEWLFDSRYESNVRAILCDLFGTDGTPVATVTMHIRLDEVRLLGRIGSEVKIGGRTILRKFDRDRLPQIGEGVAVISGGLRSYGGSRSHPSIEAETDTVIEVLNVPVDLARRHVEADPAVYQIVEEAQPETLTPAETSLVESLRSLSPDRLALVMAELHQAIA